MHNRRNARKLLNTHFTSHNSRITISPRTKLGHWARRAVRERRGHPRGVGGVEARGAAAAVDLPPARLAPGGAAGGYLPYARPTGVTSA
jgi:hypothetical protein